MTWPSQADTRTLLTGEGRVLATIVRCAALSHSASEERGRPQRRAKAETAGRGEDVLVEPVPGVGSSGDQR